MFRIHDLCPFSFARPKVPLLDSASYAGFKERKKWTKSPALRDPAHCILIDAGKRAVRSQHTARFEQANVLPIPVSHHKANDGKRPESKAVIDESLPPSSDLTGQEWPVFANS